MRIRTPVHYRHDPRVDLLDRNLPHHLSRLRLAGCRNVQLAELHAVDGRIPVHDTDADRFAGSDQYQYRSTDQYQYGRGDEYQYSHTDEYQLAHEYQYSHTDEYQLAHEYQYSHTDEYQLAHEYQYSHTDEYQPAHEYQYSHADEYQPADRDSDPDAVDDADQNADPLIPGPFGCTRCSPTPLAHVRAMG